MAVPPLTPAPQPRASVRAEPAAQPSEPLAELLWTLARQLADGVQCRAALAACELATERLRLGQSLQRGAIVALLLFLGAQVLILLAVALVWDTPQRLPVLIGLVLALVIAAGVAIARYRAVAHSTLFDATLGEIARDLGTRERRPDGVPAGASR